MFGKQKGRRLTRKTLRIMSDMVEIPMKYIRTKDEVFKVSGYLEEHTNEIQDFVKQADAIEELCDEFVYVSHKKPVIGYSMKCDYSNTVVYGAIWTDKGLIYVAKMNEEGCLELL